MSKTSDKKIPGQPPHLPNGQLRESRKVVNGILKALQAWEKENKSVKDNEHYSQLKKTIEQYDRVLSAAEKRK